MSLIDVELNGQPATLESGSTVRELVSEHTGKELNNQGQAVDGTRLGVAVAINGDIVPRSSWATAAVPAHARIDLVTAAQGG